MENRNNVKDIRQSINLYFDNELCREDREALLNKVNNDPRCSKMFDREKNFRAYIRNNVKRPSVSPDLIQTIKDRIRVV